MDVYWMEQRQSDVPVGSHWLSTDELDCLGTLSFPKRRGDWRLGRWTAKRALSVYLKLGCYPQSLANIEIRPAASGAPEAFVGRRPAAASISLSHSNGSAVCAIAPFGTALGCDLELIEPRSDAFVADYFTTEEQALVAQMSVKDRPKLLALLWSAKESALKALHEGLRLDTRSVTVSLRENAINSASDRERCSKQSGLTLGQQKPIWRQLAVRYTNGDVFQGWWRQSGDLLLSLVAAPPPFAPIALEIPTWNG
jgi:4'-phosphopantetheinyl transferase